MAGQRPPLRREVILQAARALIIADGLEALSLRKLASQIGVTAPAMYAHVGDKRDLLRALAEEEFERLVARFNEIEVTDPIERIKAHGRAYVKHTREQPELFRVMFMFPPELTVADVPDDVNLPGATKAFAIAAEAVEAAIDAGALVSDNPLLAALTLWAGVHGVASALQLGFGLPVELEDQLMDEVTDRILAGYQQ